MSQEFFDRIDFPWMDHDASKPTADAPVYDWESLLVENEELKREQVEMKEAIKCEHWKMLCETATEELNQLRSSLVDCCSEKDALLRTIDRAKDKLNTVIFDSNSILSDVNRILLGSEQLPRKEGE